MRHLLFIFTLIFNLTACVEEPKIVVETCVIQPAVDYPSITEIVDNLPDPVLQALAESDYPDEEGAMGRNKNGYFHVRFQMGISNMAAYAVDKKTNDLLDKTITAIEYSFSHQNPTGDFELQIPAEYLAYTSTSGDLASGVAFFTSSLGSALVLLERDEWAVLQPEYERIEALRTKIELLGNYLLSSERLLQAVDAQAPNRLLFDAVAFYSLGEWLSNNELKESGIHFARLAMALQTQMGYYIEGGGWDSSYNGVALENGFRFISLLPEDDIFVYEFYSSLSCASHWQAGRVLSTGEISTEGNTRVFSGGEQFLGQEKLIAFKSTVISFLCMYQFTGDLEWKELADLVIDYYS